MKIDVTREYENEDGSVTLDFDLDDEAEMAMLRIGIMTCIKRGLEASKEDYDYPTN